LPFYLLAVAAADVASLDGKHHGPVIRRGIIRHFDGRGNPGHVCVVKAGCAIRLLLVPVQELSSRAPGSVSLEVLEADPPCGGSELVCKGVAVVALVLQAVIVHVKVTRDSNGLEFRCSFQLSDQFL
jgi:hypothetical protein